MSEIKLKYERKRKMSGKVEKAMIFLNFITMT